MKLNELKTQVNELDMSDVIGNYGSAGVKQIANRLNPWSGGAGALSVKDKMASDMFVRDFIGRASEDLTRAIKGRQVNPNNTLGGAADTTPAPGDPYERPDGTPPTPSTDTGAPAPGADSGAPTADTGSPAPESPTPPGTPKANPASQKQTIQNLNNYVRNASSALNRATTPQQKMALTKELVNFMADRKDYPEWSNALSTVQQVIKSGRLDPNFTNAAINRVKAGQTMAESWQMYWIDKLLESVQLTWKDIGIVTIKESVSSWKLVDGKYQKLNNIFESIVEAGDPYTPGSSPTPAAGGGAGYPDTISSYLQKMFKQYTRSKSNKPMSLSPEQIASIKEITDQAEREYRSLNPMKRGGVAAIKKLANLAYSLSYSNQPGYQHGKASAAADATPGAAGANVDPLAAFRSGGAATGAARGDSKIEPATTQVMTAIQRMSASPSNADDLIAVVKLGLQKLYKTDRQAYTQLLASLKQQSGSEPKYTPPSVSPSPAPSPSPSPALAETRRIKK